METTLLELTRKCHCYNPKEIPGYYFMVKSTYVGIIPEFAYKELLIFNDNYPKFYNTKAKPFITVPFKEPDDQTLLYRTNLPVVTFNDNKEAVEELNLDTFEGRSKVIANMFSLWRESKKFHCLAGWRDELYPIFGKDQTLLYRTNLPVVTFNDNKEAVEELNLDTFEGRSKVIANMFSLWRESKKFHCLAGWRDELYPIFGKDHKPLLVIERAGGGLLGIRHFGVHINGYVRDIDENGKSTLKMWIAKRAITKQTFPDMYDNVVAGGLPVGQTPIECAIRECMEEAYFPPEIAKKVVPVGAVSYTYYNIDGIKPETQYLYDLELSKDDIPKINDGEVQSFNLWDFDKITEVLKNQEFSPKAGLIVIEFMIRHGIITPNNEKDYLDIISSFHNDVGLPGPAYYQ